MNRFLVRAQSILNSIRNAIGGIKSRIKSGYRTSGGWLGSKSLTASAGNIVKGLTPRVSNLVATVGTGGLVPPMIKQPVFHASGKVSYEKPGETEAERLASSTGVSTAIRAGRSTPSSRATKTVVPKKFITPTRHAPTLAEIQAGIRKIQAQIPGVESKVNELTRTQAPIPSRRRAAAGITPPPPVSRTRNKETKTPAIEALAIRSYRSGGGAVPNPAAVPTPPTVERIPLAKKVARTSIPKSIILRELKKARGRKSGFVLLPEARPLEARPRKLRVTV